jgi:integrase
MPRTATGQVIERRGKRGKTFAIRYRVNGDREFETLGTVDEGWDRPKAEEALKDRLAAVRLGTWEPPRAVLVVENRGEPTFHEFATEYVNGRQHELRTRSVEALEWALSGHLLQWFARHRLSEITPQEVDRYRVAKVRERQELEGAIRRGEPLREEVIDRRGRKTTRALRGLSNGSVNKTIAVLARVLDQALEYGWIETNPARGKRRRLKAERPRRTWLELDEVRDLLDGAREHRALLATMLLAGLRVSEACALRWRDVDLARARLRVAESKTEAGERAVELSPDLRDELAAHKARARATEPADLVFTTRRGTARDRSNVRARVLTRAVEQANEARAKAGRPSIVGVTNHSLRRTFASLLYEAGASPAFVMAQMGHASSALALEVYARKMERGRDTGERMDALLRGAEWAQTGTNGPASLEALSDEKTESEAKPLQ